MRAERLPGNALTGMHVIKPFQAMTCGAVPAGPSHDG
jgi:hypothetical protein